MSMGTADKKAEASKRSEEATLTAGAVIALVEILRADDVESFENCLKTMGVHPDSPAAVIIEGFAMLVATLITSEQASGILDVLPEASGILWSDIMAENDE